MKQFQRRRFLEIDQSKTRIACGSHVLDWSISKNLRFRGEDFLESTNQKQELSVATMFVNGSGRNEQS
jgi:hypothetical protein